MKFSQFSVGQYVSFDKTFSLTDYEKFRDFSADSNPLHWNRDFALASGSAQPILPLGLATSPFSAIAGMAFPGVPSLIISSSYNAHSPVHYDRDITYSAKITHISAEKRILKLELKAYEKTVALISGEMVVQARFDEWEIPADLTAEFTLKQPNNLVLITGSDGAIGSACATQFEKAGWRVIRHSRKRQAAEVITADLSQEEGRSRLAEAVKQYQPALIIHSASADIIAPLQELIATNYQSLKSLTEASLPGMLAAQRGRIINIGSVAQQRASEPLTDYAGAKSLADWYLQQTALRYRENGIETTTILCDLTRSAFSSALDLSGTTPLEPEEVAESVLTTGLQQQRLAGHYILTSNGLFELRDEEKSAAALHDIPPEKTAHTPAGVNAAVTHSRSALRALLNQILPDSVGKSDQQLRMNNISGWDSMIQIAIALEVEEKFGITLSGSAISELTSFDALCQAIESR